MTDYDLLGLMDTHKQMKLQGIGVPDTFAEFLEGIQPINETGPSLNGPVIKNQLNTYYG